MSLTDLPPAVWETLLSHLDFPSTKSLFRTCKHIRECLLTHIEVSVQVPYEGDAFTLGCSAATWAAADVQLCIKGATNSRSREEAAAMVAFIQSQHMLQEPTSVHSLNLRIKV